MCGISGVVSFGEGSGESLTRGVQKMNACQANRGPDDEGIFTSAPPSGGSASGPRVSIRSSRHQSAFVVLGHRRLSIIDLSRGGHQPMAYPHQSAKTRVHERRVITFNGEIYNFRDLKKDLEKKGYLFKTKTDTEVILAAYEAYGTDAFGKLRGMFAFALWDEAKQKLFLVRDRFGIKPLYYAAEGSRIVFASTVRAIAESGLVVLSKNDDAWLAFLLFGSVPLPLTTRNEIQAVPEGCFFEFSRAGMKKVRYYHLLPFFVNTRAASAEYLGGITEVLRDSVSSHLVSDAPLGVFLSGGLDSSAIAALAAASREAPVTTLSVFFSEDEFSEWKYQRMVAERIGSEHREVLVIKKDFLDTVDEALAAMDQPTVDGVNTYFIAKAARDAGLKVVLSGLGADELFLGYRNFRRAKTLKTLSSVPFSRALSALGGKYAKFSFLKRGSILGFYLVFRGIFPPAEAADIMGVSEKHVFDFLSALENRLFGEEKRELLETHPVQLLSYLETKLYMQSQLLKDSDGMGMRHSIEIRVPFVDHRVFEYVAPIPPAMKLGLFHPYESAKIRMNPRLNKPLLVNAVKDLIPSDVYARKKMGFTFPFEKWLKESPEFAKNKTFTHWSKIWAVEVLKRTL